MTNSFVNCIIQNKLGEFLFQKKDAGYPFSPGKWVLFGGAIEQNESAEEAIRRELLEEIGISFKVSFLFESAYKINKMKLSGATFFARFDKKVEHIKLGEGNGFAFFSEDELNKNNIRADDLSVINKFIRSGKN